MSDEKLEFSAQDLGRMGKWLGIPINDVRDWVALQGNNTSDYHRIVILVAEGYLEE